MCFNIRREKAVISCFILFVLCNFTILEAVSKEKNIVKPKVNQNTPIIKKYGCERPKSWGNISKDILISSKNANNIFLNKNHNSEKEDEDILLTIPCVFSTRNYILFNTSLIEPKVEVKNTIIGKKEKLLCKIISGKWRVFDGEKYIEETEPKNIQIDHILPFAYIRLNMKDCKLTSKYYNFLENLEPMFGSENQKKKDIICSNEEECWKQIKICNSISNYFDDKHLCDNLLEIVSNNFKNLNKQQK